MRMEGESRTREHSQGNGGKGGKKGSAQRAAEFLLNKSVSFWLVSLATNKRYCVENTSYLLFVYRFAVGVYFTVYW